MKIALLLLMIICCFIPAMAMEGFEADHLFAQAAQAYKDGRFDEAIRLDEKIIAGNLESAAMYYNLGNAYLKNKSLGKAIVNYLRSEKMTPRDADVRANLSFARSNVENYQPFSSPSALKSALSLKQVSEEELKWIALFAFITGGTFFLVGLYKGVRTKRIILWTTLISFIWMYCLVVIMMRTPFESGHAVVITGADAKYEPSQDATTYFKLSQGAEVRLLRRENGWGKIERPDGKAAWVSVDAIEKVFP